MFWSSNSFVEKICGCGALYGVALEVIRSFRWPRVQQCGQPWYAQVTLLLHELHWLPNCFQVWLKVLVTTYKSYKANGLVTWGTTHCIPLYLSNWFDLAGLGCCGFHWLNNVIFQDPRSLLSLLQCLLSGMSPPPPIGILKGPEEVALCPGLWQDDGHHFSSFSLFPYGFVFSAIFDYLFCVPCIFTSFKMILTICKLPTDYYYYYSIAKNQHWLDSAQNQSMNKSSTLGHFSSYEEIFKNYWENANIFPFRKFN